MMSLIRALAATLALSIATPALGLPAPGEALGDATLIRYVGSNESLSSFIGQVSGASDRPTMTVWMFFAQDQTADGKTFDTVATTVTVDCSTRAISRSAIVALRREPVAAGHASRVVVTEAFEEPFETYAAGSILAGAAEQLCATAPVDPAAFPTFTTLEQARVFGRSRSARYGAPD